MRSHIIHFRTRIFIRGIHIVDEGILVFHHAIHLALGGRFGKVVASAHALGQQIGIQFIQLFKLFSGDKPGGAKEGPIQFFYIHINGADNLQIEYIVQQSVAQIEQVGYTLYYYTFPSVVRQRFGFFYPQHAKLSLCRPMTYSLWPDKPERNTFLFPSFQVKVRSN